MEFTSLTEALASPKAGGSCTVCKFSQIRDLLNEEEQQALDKAIDGIRQDAGMGKSKRFSTTWLVKVLSSFGHYISTSTVQRHINRECSCERVVR